jgi:hypothetical protein
MVQLDVLLQYFPSSALRKNHERLERLYKRRKRFVHDYVCMLRCSYGVHTETFSFHFRTQMALLCFCGI